MKLGKILLGASMILATATFAQDGEGAEGGENRECRRMKKIANDAMSLKDYKEATSYFLKSEVMCGPDFMKNDKGEDVGAANYQRLTGCLIQIINAEKDLEIQKIYADTLIDVYNRMDEKNLYDEKNDMRRGYYYLKISAPNYVKADFFFTRGIAKQGTAIKEMYIPLYYYNTYTMFFMEPDVEKKSALKKRMINDYFDLSELVSKANLSIKAQESLTSYFRTVVQSCDDLTPEIAGFISTLPEDVEASKASLMSLITLMEDMKCTDSQEYMDLINKYLELDPESASALEMKAKILEKQKKFRDANAIYVKLLELEEVTDERKAELRYKIVRNIFNLGSYKAAYNKAMKIQGKYRGKALVIAGQCVGQTAMSCGESTFDRKCNYIYAVQLLEQGGAGSGLISSYKAKYPNTEEVFGEGNPTSKTLTCWNVTVNPSNP